MDRPTIELHEKLIRLAKGMVSAREQFAHRGSGTRAIGPIAGSPFAALLDRPTPELKASIGVWENWLKLETSSTA